jgi:O-antigen/teichoic acid export membrane protein
MPTKGYHILEVLRGAGIAFVLRGIGAGLAFALNVVIGRMLGAEGTGLYFLALSVVSIGAVVTKLGLDNTLLRFVAAGASLADWNRVVGVFRTGTRLAGAASLGGAIIVFAAAPLMSEHLFGEPALAPPLRAISVGIFTFAMMMLLSECLKGLKRIRDSMLVSGVLYPLIALVLIWPLASLFGPTGAALAYVLGTGGAAAIGYAMWRANIRNHAAPEPAFERATLWQSARPLWVMDLINRAILPLAPLFLLGIWGTAADAGVFGAATRVSMILALFYTASITILVPKYAELYNTGQIDMLGQVARRSALTFTLAGLPVLAALFYFRLDVMLLFGPEFGSGAPVLAILLISQMALLIMGSMGYILLVSGHLRDMRNVAIIAAFFMLIAALTLTPSYTSIGAAISAAIGVAAMSLGNTIFVHRRLGISLISPGELQQK